MPFIDLLVAHEPDRTLARKLAAGVTERTARILRKDAAVTAVAVRFVPPSQWTIGDRSLDELGVSSFWLDIRVTAGTNTPEEKAAYLAEVHAFMGAVLGRVHEDSYAMVQEGPADTWGHGGITQAQRYARAKLQAAG